MKISLINGICLSNDAISNAIRDEVTWLGEMHDVRLYTYACDNDALPSQIVKDVRDVAFDAHFQASDIVIFHFGVYYPLFDLLTVAPHRAKRIVVFHNITPKEFVALSSHPLIDKSFVQMANMAFAEHVVCDSQTNLNVLRSAGIRTPATVLPLALHARPIPPRIKPSFDDGVLRLAFVGRFVRSKGPTELLGALKKVLRECSTLRVQLDLIGSLTFSDEKILTEIKERSASMATQFGMRLHISLRGNASEHEKLNALLQADLFVLPSYHEGFCVPILEALASGCCVIAYDNSNIPHIAGGLAMLVPSGDTDQLAAAIRDAADVCLSAPWRAEGDTGYSRFAERAAAYVAQFNPQSTKQRFLHLIRRLASTTLRDC